MHNRGLFAVFSLFLDLKNAYKIGIKEKKNKQLWLNDMNGPCLLNQMQCELSDLSPIVPFWKIKFIKNLHCNLLILVHEISKNILKNISTKSLKKEKKEISVYFLWIKIILCP